MRHPIAVLMLLVVLVAPASAQFGPAPSGARIDDVNTSAVSVFSSQHTADSITSASGVQPGNVNAFTARQNFSSEVDITGPFRVYLAAYFDGLVTVGRLVSNGTVEGASVVEGGTALAAKYLGIAAQASDAAKMAGNTWQTFMPSKATIETLLAGDTSARAADAVKLAGNTAATYLPSKATIETLLGTDTSVRAADAVKLAGNTASTYGNSKATIEALLTGQVNSHTHNADHVIGGQISSNMLPDAANFT